MNLVESVYQISESFMKDPEYVFMNEKEIEFVANDMKLVGKPTFPLPEVGNVFKTILMELVAASVNYCYWYGKHNIRPNNSSSTTMYAALMEAFDDYVDDFPTRANFKKNINRFVEELAIRRFPLLEDRKRHLYQLLETGERFCEAIYQNHEEIGPNLETLVSLFPGFASDMFLKRASLFFIQLFRRFGWFENDLHNLHVPADYQVPKMLNHFGCLIYEDELQYAIDTDQLIPKHSQHECEIRAATVLTVKNLCILTGWNVAEVDGFFFTKRHDSTEPFHLTITTDY